MTDKRQPPKFNAPVVVNSPEVTASLASQRSLLQQGILYRTYKTICPLDLQELNSDSRIINFHILEKVGLLNPKK